MSTTATTRGLGVKGPRRQASRAVTRGAVLLLIASLTSCGLFRPSAERQCRKAQGLITTAVRICPEAAQLRTDTLTIHLPGDSSDGAGLWTDADIDSILAGCDQFREALAAERQVAAIIQDSNAGVIIGQHHLIDSLLTSSRGPGRRGRGDPSSSSDARARLRSALCQWPDILDSTDLHILRIRYSPSGPLYTIIDRERAAKAVTTTQSIKNGPIEVQAGANGWLVALTALGWLLAVVLLLHFLSERGMRLRIQDELQKPKR